MRRRNGISRIRRFENKVFKTDGCWLWQGAMKREYGGFWNGSKYELAHRFAYRYYKNEEIPEGKQLHHKCEKTRCVNPEHLELVTCRQNLMKSKKTIAKVNSQKTKCPQGHEYNLANTGNYKGMRYCRKCKTLNTLRWRKLSYGTG